MRVLVIKTSSLGDVLHTLPALTDAARVLPTIQFDWLVEANFAEVPAWHANVKTVIPVTLRRWRKQPWQAYRSGEVKQFMHNLRSQNYDKVIDAQGLLKSALLTRLAKGERYGLSRHSAREPLASLFYQQTCEIAKGQHAIVRVRELFAKALGYSIPSSAPQSGIDITCLPCYPLHNTLVFLHGTTWANKHWPEEYWQQLAQLVTANGWQIVIPWGHAAEYERAQRLAAISSKITVLPKMSLTELAGILAQAKAAVSVDTGLSHLAAALAVPTIGLYGPTHPALTGSYGPGQLHLAADFACAPCLKRQCHYQQPSRAWPACFSELTPDRVWQALYKVLVVE